MCLRSFLAAVSIQERFLNEFYFPESFQIFYLRVYTQLLRGNKTHGSKNQLCTECVVGFG